MAKITKVLGVDGIDWVRNDPHEPEGFYCRVSLDTPSPGPRLLHPSGAVLQVVPIHRRGEVDLFSAGPAQPPVLEVGMPLLSIETAARWLMDALAHPGDPVEHCSLCGALAWEEDSEGRLRCREHGKGGRALSWVPAWKALEALLP